MQFKEPSKTGNENYADTVDGEVWFIGTWNVDRPRGDAIDISLLKSFLCQNDSRSHGRR